MTSGTDDDPNDADDHAEASAEASVELPVGTEHPGPRSRLGTVVTRRPFLSALAVIVAATGAIGAGLWVKDMVDPPYKTVQSSIPTAPGLDAAPGETILTIDASRSEARYEVDERIVGASASTAVGRTKAIAGEVALNRTEPAKSRLGTIVIDVEQLTSDSTLRDARIRSDFLESHEYPLAKFVPSGIEGLPAALTDGVDVPLTVHGDLSIKQATRPVTFDATASVSGDEMHVRASTTVRMSDFGVGPISVVGLVSTDDEFEIGLDLVAVDATRVDVPTDVAAPTPDVSVTGEGASFAKDVQPILERNCVSCHTTGQIGADVLTINTAGDAAKYASGLALVTANRYMPPWPASTVGIALKHSRALDQGTIDTLKRWADGGAKLDVEASTELHAPPPDPSQTIRTDVVARMAEPYLGSGQQVNDYRCLILDPKFTSPTIMTGYSFVPGTRQVVHHALAYRVPADARPTLDAKDGSDGRPGWQCFLGEEFGGAGAAGARNDLVAGWVPGQVPLNFGGDAGFRFEPGDFLVVQIHYHYGPMLADQSEIHLQTQAPGPDTRELDVVSPTGPVELPCPVAQSSGPLCDRDAALAELTRLYGPGAPVVADGLVGLCGPNSTTSDPVTGNGTTTCDGLVRRNGRIVDVLGHMHELGRSFRMTLNPGTPGQKVLLDIPTWNFDWQLNYQPVDPVVVKRGDVIRIECSWDRALRYDPEPRYITFAEGTEDEMCFSTYTVLPNNPRGDRGR